MVSGNISSETPSGGIVQVVLKRDSASYKVRIEVTDYKSTDDSATLNIIKVVKAIITYKVNNAEKSIELSTILK